MYSWACNLGLFLWLMSVLKYWQHGQIIPPGEIPMGISPQRYKAEGRLGMDSSCCTSSWWEKVGTYLFPVIFGGKMGQKEDDLSLLCSSSWRFLSDGSHWWGWVFPKPGLPGFGAYPALECSPQSAAQHAHTSRLEAHRLAAEPAGSRCAACMKKQVCQLPAAVGGYKADVGFGFAELPPVWGTSHVYMRHVQLT